MVVERCIVVGGLARAVQGVGGCGRRLVLVALVGRMDGAS